MTQTPVINQMRRVMTYRIWHTPNYGFWVEWDRGREITARCPLLYVALLLRLKPPKSQGWSRHWRNMRIGWLYIAQPSGRLGAS